MKLVFTHPSKNKLASLEATLVRNSAHSLTHSLTGGVKCRATSVAKKGKGKWWDKVGLELFKSKLSKKILLCDHSTHYAQCTNILGAWMFKMAVMALLSSVGPSPELGQRKTILIVYEKFS